VYLSVGASTGALAPTSIEAAYFAQYGPGGEGPANHWYADESTKEFVANEQAGKHWPSCGGNDNQADAVVHAVAAVALYGGNTTAVLQAADALIRVTQNTDDAAAFGLASARIFERILVLNMSGYDAVAAAIADLQDPGRLLPYAEDAALAEGLVKMLAQINVSNFDVVQEIGQSCDYPNTLWTTAHLVAQLGSTPDDFVSGLRQTILAGGDSGSRGYWVGAVQAARMGSAALLPADWVGKASYYPTAAPLAAQFVAHRAPAASPAGV
jgi:ADP-ribosylglycohydrolase